METTDRARFRHAYWGAFRDLDTVRLRLWERFGLTLPQLRVLHQIRREPGVTTGDLARGLGITASTTSGLVGKLVDRGLVTRTTVPGDRRQLPLHLTEAGAALTGDLSEVSRAFLDRVAGELGDDLPAVAAALEALATAAGRVRAAEREDATAAALAASGGDGA
jgi:DNA-binding MarR family transcriptional regulator